MGVRTGKAFLASLRDQRRIHIDGERVTDVTRIRALPGRRKASLLSTTCSMTRRWRRA